MPTEPQVSPLKKPLTVHQRRMVAWLQDNCPRGWAVISGPNRQSARGLEREVLAIVQGAPGKWRIRLTPEGRSFSHRL